MADVMAIGAVAAVAAAVRATKSGNQEVKRLLERGAFFGVTEACRALAWACRLRQQAR
jgi:hypothetical protein